MPDGHPAVFASAPAPEGAPTVLLYCHYDVQPPLDEAAWESPPFELTERDGRWYGRGAADCKGNVAAHLTALRALGPELPVGVKFIAEGAEEQETGGLEEFVPTAAELLRADAVIVMDSGNFEVGVPTLTTTLRGIANLVVRVRTLAGPMHSGSFGGAAPDALLALNRMLATLHDERGNVAVDGLPADQAWDGDRLPRRAVPPRRRRPRRGRAGRRRHGGRDAVGAPRGERARHRLPAGGRLDALGPGRGGGPGQHPRPAGSRSRCGPGSRRRAPRGRRPLEGRGRDRAAAHRGTVQRRHRRPGVRVP